MISLYNPFAPEQTENPYPMYAAARATAPVFYSETFGMWMVTRYEDVSAVLKDHVRFSSANAVLANDIAPQARAIMEQGYPEQPALVDNDLPGHARLRNLVNKAFTPRTVAKLEPNIRQIANELVDSFVQDGRADLISQFAFRLPGSVIADLLGIPRSDIDDCKRWSDGHIALMSAGNLSVEQQVEYAHGYRQLQQYLVTQLEDRGQHPRDDLLTRMVQSSAEQDSSANIAELMFMSIQLFNAGHETTTSLLGSVLLLLLEQPERLAALRADPSIAEALIEETLRLESPVLGLFRTTTEEVQLGGVTIPAGARLQVLYASANRDPVQFTAPDEFNLQRPNKSQHLAFGRGIHFCIGAALARAEGRIALEVLSQRLPNLRLDGAPTRKPHFFLRGFYHLPIAWDAVTA